MYSLRRTQDSFILCVEHPADCNTLHYSYLAQALALAQLYGVQYRPRGLLQRVNGGKW